MTLEKNSDHIFVEVKIVAQFLLWSVSRKDKHALL